MTYNWQQKDWPNFRFETRRLESQIAEFAEKTGRISGMLAGLSPEAVLSAEIGFMVAEAVKSSEIEGEYLSRQDVMSSIQNQFDPSGPHTNVSDARATGIAQLIVQLRDTFREPLSAEQLFEWHQLLLPYARMKTGAWRTHSDPMQVVSGRHGRMTVHFEAPPSAVVPDEMKRFISWFNTSAPNNSDMYNAPIRAAIAHLYFETIHPFEDGNGRIGRAIAEKALFQGIGRITLISLSEAIEANKSLYYEAVKSAQRSNEITPWIAYFMTTLIQAQSEAEKHIAFLLKKASFYDRFRDRFNERQHKVIERMFQAGPLGFDGGMSAQKYVGITKASKATATRDLQELFDMGALAREGEGRNTRYSLKTEPV